MNRPRPPRRQPWSRPAPPSTVTSVRPDPRVWQAALRLAQSDVRRLVVEPDASVIVRNR